MEMNLQVEAFYAKYPDAGAGANARKAALDRIKQNMYWLKKNEATIGAWLKKKKFLWFPKKNIKLMEWNEVFISFCTGWLHRGSLWKFTFHTFCLADGFLLLPLKLLPQKKTLEFDFCVIFFFIEYKGCILNIFWQTFPRCETDMSLKYKDRYG